MTGCAVQAYAGSTGVPFSGAGWQAIGGGAANVTGTGLSKTGVLSLMM